jgi:hypothetical protein
MGGSKSQTVKQFFQMDAVTEMTTNQVTKNAVKVGNEQTSINKLELIIKGNVIGCQIKTGQSINATMTSTVGAAVSEVVSMANDIMSMLEQSASSNMEMLTELGSLSDIIGDSSQNIEQEIKTAIRTTVTQNITTENLTEVFNEQININQQRLVFGGNIICPEGKGGLDLTQDITAQLTAEVVSELLTEKLLENKVVNDLATKAEADIKQENTGFASIFDSIFSGIGGIIGQYGKIIYACVALLCVACIGLVVFMMSPAGQQATKNASAVAAKKYG